MSATRATILLSLLGLTSAFSLPQVPLKPHHRPADLPHSMPSHSFWTHSPGANPLAGEGSTGLLTSEADVCIIGSGITGVSTAYHLARAVEQGSVDKGLRAVVLEARDFCSGATGRNGGNLTPYEVAHFRDVESRFGAEEALRQYALEHHTSAAMARVAREGGWADAVDFVEGGHVDVYMTEKHLAQVRADSAAAVKAGRKVNVTWMGREEMNATYGTYHWGAQTPGYNLWPLKFVTQLFKEAKAMSPDLGLRLHTRTPVLSVSQSRSTSRRWELSTPRGSVGCSYVVYATNAYTSHLLPHMAGTGPQGIMPVRGQVIATRAAVSLEDLTKVSWIGNSGYWFPRPATDENPLVILGGAREDAGPPFEVDTTDDSVVNHVVGETLRAFLPEMFPSKYQVGREPEAEWTGIMGYTALDIPFVGPVLDQHGSGQSHSGQFISAGYAGHGMPRAYGCAQVVVDMLVSELQGEKFEVEMLPEWFPRSFLTANRF
ncbi:unnamed protein product [Mycena citricolor]|uniref:FAD dependent oxidoreductase domain-containing protein n=1 Tax=Mycena citricolor TaxID=2018698 RepID=A0AAD2HXY1_9AGAR|nr:unnamed protein product [Mycena citricolor]